MAVRNDSAEDPFVALAIETDAIASIWSEQGTALWVNPALTRALGGAPGSLGALAASAAQAAAPVEHELVDVEGRTRRARSRVCAVRWQGEAALLVAATRRSRASPRSASRFTS